MRSRRCASLAFVLSMSIVELPEEDLGTSRVEDVLRLEPRAPRVSHTEPHGLELAGRVGVRADDYLYAMVHRHAQVEVGEVEPVGVCAPLERNPPRARGL